jgi:glycosyltransferase involved in cell wall biosynthesis
MASYERAHLLERSLRCYELLNFDNKEMELIVIDDHSTDGTDELVRTWSNRTGIRSTVIVPSPKKEAWRDCGVTLNVGIRASLGKHVLLTHPEVMIGKDSVKACVDVLEEFENNSAWATTDDVEIRIDRGLEGSGYIKRLPIGLYACCRIYYLSPKNQEGLDTVDWDKNLLNVRNLPGFYDEDHGAPDFTHQATDMVAQPRSRLRTWESWVFGGMSRESWKRLGGMLETNRWGSVDVAFMQRRRALGIANHTCPEDTTICAHQNHDLPYDVKTPRVESDWKEELKDVDFTNPGLLRYPGVDNLGW